MSVGGTHIHDGGALYSVREIGTYVLLTVPHIMILLCCQVAGGWTGLGWATPVGGQALIRVTIYLTHLMGIATMPLEGLPPDRGNRIHPAVDNIKVTL